MVQFRSPGLIILCFGDTTRVSIEPQFVGPVGLTKSPSISNRSTPRAVLEQAVTVGGFGDPRVDAFSDRVNTRISVYAEWLEVMIIRGRYADCSAVARSGRLRFISPLCNNWCIQKMSASGVGWKGNCGTGSASPERFAYAFQIQRLG